MQIHATHEPASGDFPVHLNGRSANPFAIISLGAGGQLTVFVESVADADRGIRAWVRARELLLGTQALAGEPDGGAPVHRGEGITGMHWDNLSSGGAS